MDRTNLFCLLKIRLSGQLLHTKLDLSFVWVYDQAMRANKNIPTATVIDLLSRFGRCEPQCGDWTGKSPLPPKIAEFYLSVGPLDIELPKRRLRFPSLANLGPFKTFGDTNFSFLHVILDSDEDGTDWAVDESGLFGRLIPFVSYYDYHPYVEDVDLDLATTVGIEAIAETIDINRDRKEQAWLQELESNLTKIACSNETAKFWMDEIGFY